MTDAASMSVIAGRYHLVGSPLPAGGMAQVYKAFDVKDEHGQVAVKLLPPIGAERHPSFERERRALARLDHPSIVPLLDSGEDESSHRAYLVFPWFERRLQEHLRQQGPMSWEAWWEEFGSPILMALEESHQKEIEHRDLKPANIMLDPDGRPKVIDFGIAKLYGLVAPEGTVDAASAPFTPPEQVSQSPPMTRDTHAWAALTVFALSGHDPYASSSDPYRLLEAARVAARVSIPIPLRALVDDSLSADPSRRPRNAMVLTAKITLALAQVSRDEDQHALAAAPAVSVVFRRGLRDRLETDLGLFGADVDELLRRELAGPVVVAEVEPGRFILTCPSLSIRAAPNESGDALLAFGAVQPDAESLDRDRDRGWSSTVRFELDGPADGQIGEDALRTLRQAVSEDQQRRRIERGDGRSHPFKVWRGLLALLRAYETSQERPARYTAVSRTSRGVRLRMTAPAEPDLLGEEVVGEASGDREAFGVVVDVTGRDVVIRLSSDGARELLPSGLLRRDRRAQLWALRRQQRGLDAVEYGRAARPDLDQLLATPEKLRIPAEQSVSLFQQPLDEPKQRAVRAALGSEDLLIVRGPPGTGKTTFICELVVQEVLRNPEIRILIASQSHAALDHALNGIQNLAPTLRLLRFARQNDERVAENIRPLLVDAQLASWKKEAISGGRAQLRAWAKQHGVNVDQVETAGRLVALAAALREQRELEARRARLESELATLRGEHPQAVESATASQAILERLDELDELRVEHILVADQVREAMDRLVSLGEIRRRTTRRSLDPIELQRRAQEVLPADSELASACRRRLDLLTDWEARFGLGPAFRAAALARSQVVAATCVGLGGLRGAESVEFDLVIVDEASKATALELMIPLARGRRHVLVGDERQLPPYVEQEALTPAVVAERGLTLDEITKPLFEVLVERAPIKNVVTLTNQHRMHPAIGRLVSECFYDGQLTSAERPTLTWLNMIAPKPVTWLTTAHLDDRREHRTASGSVTNRCEAAAICAFLITADGLASAARRRPHVAVLTGYSAQRDDLDSRVERLLPRMRALTIECSTVDAFQGRQADVVLFSLTRSNRQRQLGFTKERPRLNVALSRARDALVIVGDHAFAASARNSGALRRVLEHVEGNPDHCATERARL